MHWHTNIGRQLRDNRWEIEILWWAEQEEFIKWRLTFARVFLAEACDPGIYIASYSLTDNNTDSYWPIFLDEYKKCHGKVNEAR